MKKVLAILSILFAVVITNSCRQDKYVPNVCFKENILPVFISKCSTPGCHGSNSHEGKYNFTTYEGIMKAVTANHANQSEAYTKIKGNNPEMPPKGSPQLTAKEIDNIKYWINFGAENSSCGATTCDTLSYITYATNIKPVMDTYCVGCHPSGGAFGHDLSSYTGVKASVTTGKFIPAIKQTGLYPMPQGGSKLSACDLAKIDKWIANGMPEQ